MPLLFNFDQLFSFRLRTLNPSPLPQQPRSDAVPSPGLKARRMTKNDIWIADNRQATNVTDEKPCPTRTELAGQVAKEDVSDLRAIINELRKKLN
jgi:hypothetical protein